MAAGYQATVFQSQANNYNNFGEVIKSLRKRGINLSVFLAVSVYQQRKKLMIEPGEEDREKLLKVLRAISSPGTELEAGEAGCRSIEARGTRKKGQQRRWWSIWQSLIVPNHVQMTLCLH